MLPQNIQRAICISIDYPPFSGAVQSSFDAFAAEFVGDRARGIPDREGIAIQRTSFTGVGFFLFDNFDSVPLAEAFQLALKGKNRNLNKVLIVALAHVDRLFQVRVVTDNNLADATLNAPIKNGSRRLIQKVLDLVIATVQQCRLAMRQSFNATQILNRLESGIFLVVPLINRFNLAAIQDKRFACSADTGSEVIQPKVNAKHFLRQLNLLFFLPLVDVGNIKISTT